MRMSGYQTIDFQTARRNMVDNQIRCCKVLDTAVLELLETMPREEFLPDDIRSLAYMEGHVPLICGQEMLSPLQEASILQSLALQGHERVLEIGAGTGYLTSLLAMKGGEVVSCELHKELAGMATENIRKHGISNATILHVNAMHPEDMKRHKELAHPFDAIVIGAAISEIPEHLTALLHEGGQMVAFIGSNPVVSLVHMRRTDTNWQKTTLLETLLQGFEGLPEKREFVF
jgi:protein-L-isoaspartate(D-aspartate) O-methyltransferase